MNQKNVKYLMLATADQDIMAAGTVISEAADITEGYIAIVDETNETVVAEQSGKVRVVQRDGDNLIYSPFIDTTKIRRKVSTDGSAAVEQVSYIGYNGVSGALNVANDEDYIIKGMIKPVITTMSLFANVAHWSYRSSASAYQYEIAAGLLDSFNAWKKRSPQKVITADAITDTAVDAANDLVNNSTVVKGSKGITSTATAQVDTVTLDTGTSGTATIAAAGGLSKTVTFDTDYESSASNFVTANAATYLAEGIVLTSDGDDLIFTASVAGTDFTSPTITPATGDLDGTAVNTQVNVEVFEYAAAGATVVVGDFVRIGGVGAGTALTDNVYKVTAIDGSTITVDRPITNASGTYAAATSDIEVIPAADIGDMGIKFTGLPLPINPEKWNYEKVRFDLGLVEGFDSTVVVTYDTVADEGVGVEGQIAKMEYQLQMNDGQTWKQAHPTINSRAQYKDVASYPVAQVVLDVYDDNFKPLLGDVPVSFFTVIIATPNATAQATLETVFAI